MTKRLIALDALVLLAAIGLCARLFVPAHVTSIWMHQEFSGWVAPIANRLGEGKLYADGLRWPMAPLPAVVLHLFGHATWLTESVAYHLAQGATLMILFAALSFVLPRPAPLLSVLLSMPCFFALKKTMFYDALAQTWVALATLAFVALAGNRRAVALGVLCALAVLTKQSTALGLAAGCFFVIAATERRAMPVFLGSLAAAVVVLALAISPWMSLGGFLNDVLVTGSEPKGGLLTVARNLGAYAAQIAASIGIFAIFALAMKRSERAVTIPVLLPSELGSIHFAILRAGLFLVVQGERVVACFESPLCSRAALIAFAAAIGHSLSVPQFRWAEDNNPLIVFAMAALVMMVARLPFAARALALAFLLFVTLGSSGVRDRIALAQRCTESWPEVEHLRGARLLPASSGMRALVSEVRRAAPPGDEVLLLPSDPNVEAWLDRPRPKLTSAIVFVDQYWDRWVDEDFARLWARPPRVIVIGPRELWRPFFTLWQHPWWGAERLIERVERELLPARYERRAEIAIVRDFPREDTADVMDVWVLR